MLKGQLEFIYLPKKKMGLKRPIRAEKNKNSARERWGKHTKKKKGEERKDLL